MLSPQENLSRLLRNYPEAADAIYDLLLWASSSKSIIEQLEVEELMSELYGKTSDGQKHRKDHNQRLLRVRGRTSAVDDSSSRLPA